MANRWQCRLCHETAQSARLASAECPSCGLLCLLERTWPLRWVTRYQGPTVQGRERGNRDKSVSLTGTSSSQSPLPPVGSPFFCRPSAVSGAAPLPQGLYTFPVISGPRTCVQDIWSQQAGHGAVRLLLGSNQEWLVICTSSGCRRQELPRPADSLWAF